MVDSVTRPCALALIALAALAGCATPEQRVEQRRVEIATAPITHIVLIQLKDPTRAAELIEDCDRSVPGIPAVKAYSCGLPFPSDRPNVVGDYSVGFSVSFENEEGYRAYTEDPAHLALVEKWKTAWKDVRIFDFLDSPQGALMALPPSAEAGAAPAKQPGTASAGAPATAPSSKPDGPATSKPAAPPATAPSTAPR